MANGKLVGVRGWGVILIAALAMALVAGALYARAHWLPAGVSADDGTLTHPFITRIDGGDGIVVELRGASSGYCSGQEVSYQLYLKNGGTVGWQGRYCLLLLSEERALATLAGDTFALQPGKALGTSLVGRLPEGLPDGEYGLALVLPDRLASVTTITIGEVDGPAGPPSLAGEQRDPAGSRWPEPVCP